MKNISTLLSIVALVLIGILYYLHFNQQEKLNKISGERLSRDTSNFRIAYFDIDSLQEHYQYFKDVSNDVKSKENAVASELSGLQATYQKKIREWQQKGPNMSQSEGEAAQREYAQMQQRYEQRQATLDQDLQKQKMEMMTDVRKKIETYLSDYNKTKGYAFILSYEPGFMLYYKDSTFDITNDVIQGLNAQYKQQKK
jgi:outer membrane protein